MTRLTKLLAPRSWMAPRPGARTSCVRSDRLPLEWRQISYPRIKSCLATFTPDRTRSSSRSSQREALLRSAWTAYPERFPAPRPTTRCRLWPTSLATAPLWRPPPLSAAFSQVSSRWLETCLPPRSLLSVRASRASLPSRPRRIWALSFAPSMCAPLLESRWSPWAPSFCRCRSKRRAKGRAATRRRCRPSSSKRRWTFLRRSVRMLTLSSPPRSSRARPPPS
mmetsp:Transcript_8145/g.14662  ORF Transcript_8145/g.14662 Transcript_8145/m.14662 type:complete len:223 (+) Transcript_8145:518-1186(+)